ncbi:MAG: RNA 2',3'-cyclic phosphodiesterase [Candidatus Neomarinimicrobiota bacterium]|nr:RNA 2',3'-cyclic phosphodiesterase [Candidatus Neomarinimicrobiota bacterium]
MSEKLIRIFISVFVPKEIVNIKEMLKTTIDTRGIKIRWVRDGNMHLTLKFIGNTTEESIDSINNAIHDVVKDTPFINLSISGTGCFSKRDRANTLWVGIKGDLDKLEQLILNINNKLEPLGFPIERRKFLPHITIARINSNQKKKPDISNFLNTTFMELPMKIVKINLMQSQSFPKGSFYTILNTNFLDTKLE